MFLGTQTSHGHLRAHPRLGGRPARRPSPAQLLVPAQPDRRAPWPAGGDDAPQPRRDGAAQLLDRVPHAPGRPGHVARQEARAIHADGARYVHVLLPRRRTREEGYDRDARRPAMIARLVSLATAVPPHVVAQSDAREFVRHLFHDVLREDNERLLAVFEHSGIRQRHVCAPLEWFASDHAFAEKNARYVENAVRLGSEVANRALAAVGLTPRDVDHLIFVSSTGIAAPSVDARIANALGLRSDFSRTPIWGLGCAGGAAGLARARDFALARPGARVLLVALELCSLTFQRNDLSKRNLVAASLFADGAAAALVVAQPEEAAPLANGHRPLDLVAASSTFWNDTLDVMGWDVDGAGLHVVFARGIQTIVHERVRGERR